MTAHGRTIAVLAVIATATLSATQNPQSVGSPASTFNTSVVDVEIDAVVTDQHGNVVQKLTKDDFQVFEDGKPRTISTFSAVDLQLEPGPSTAITPTVVPDVPANERTVEGRVYVLMLDDLHVDAVRSQNVKQAARRFIERNVAPNDLVAVIFTGRDDAAKDFTSDKRQLLAVVDKFVGRQLRSPTLEANDNYRAQIDIGADSKSASVLSPVQSPSRDDHEAEAVRDAEAMLSRLRQVSEWLDGVHGRRRTVLLFSEGIGYDLSNLLDDRFVNGRSRAFGAMRDTLAATTRYDVSVYSIDPRGLSNAGDEAIGVSGFADQNDRTAGVGQSSLRNETRLAQASLRQLSDESGGFAAVNRNDTADVFDRIVRDNSSYYVLAYQPGSTSLDGKFHKIEVKVNRPGVTVRARRGYTALDPKQNSKGTQKNPKR